MEREILRFVARRCARHPLLLAAWFSLCALPWLLAVLGPLGPDARSLFSSRMVYEVAFVWGLIGGVTGLAAVGEMTAWLAPLGTLARLRAQAASLGSCILVPMIPLVLLDLAGRGTWLATLGASLVMAVHLVAIGLVCAQIPSTSLRSIAFLSLAWLVPALGSVPRQSIVVPVLDATRHLEATSGSPAWPAAFAPILALVLFAIGVDVIRRPAS